MRHGFEEDLATKCAKGSTEQLRLTGAVVRVTDGPDVGLVQRVEAAGLIVGSGAGCDLRLSDAMVSRRHLDVRAEPDGVRLLDRGSRNGTYFGGARLHEIVLAKDATVVLGETTLHVQLLAEPIDVRLSVRTRFGQAIATSASMRHVFELLEQAARTDVTVLLEGDSGTGKEVLAHALHEESPRKDGPFIVVDCGAIPESLVESELFGHERGAFTGAAGARAGAFELAEGGTLFLDEIGELPLDAQPKLLRALENRSFRRVGGSRTVRANVRMVAATNRKLREAVRKKEFREDLFYRLAVVHVTVPRLGDRPEDVVPLAENFLRKAMRDPHAVIAPELGALLASYSWPGNARELRNVVERFATFGRADATTLFGEGVHAGHGGDAGHAGDGGFHAGGEGQRVDLGAFDGLAYHDAKQRLIEVFHRALLPRAVSRAAGNVPRAAEALGLPKASLYRMLQQLRDHDSEG